MNQTTLGEPQWIEETGKWIRTDSDGIQYEHEESTGIWYPMYNEALVSAQQAAYSVPGVDENQPVKVPEKRKRKVYTSEDAESSRSAKHPHTQKSKPITSIYITGLPPDTTEEELSDVFSKYGIILEDPFTGKPKIKLYKDSKDRPKGDALIIYFKEESVSLAIQLQDDIEFRLGDASTKIRVQRAEFKEKDPVQTAEKKKLNIDDKKKLQKKLYQTNRRLDWDEGENDTNDKWSKIVILKNMYTQEELDEDPASILEIKGDVREECEKLGEINSVVMYDKSPGGVIAVRFREKEAADSCVALMNGRYFGGKRVEATIFDGTKYAKSEGEGDEEEEKARLDRYAKWLEEQEKKEKKGEGSPKE